MRNKREEPFPNCVELVVVDQLPEKKTGRSQDLWRMRLEAVSFVTSGWVNATETWGVKSLAHLRGVLDYHGLRDQYQIRQRDKAIYISYVRPSARKVKPRKPV